LFLAKVMIEVGWKSKRGLGSLHMFLFGLFCTVLGEDFKKRKILKNW